jgi:hypothetical protein
VQGKKAMLALNVERIKGATQPDGEHAWYRIKMVSYHILISGNDKRGSDSHGNQSMARYGAGTQG